MVACVASVAAVAYNAALTLSRVHFKSRAMLRLAPAPLWSDWLRYQTYPADVNAGSAVLGAWLVLAASRAWTSQPNWIDRAGRAVGVGWLALYFWTWVQPWVEHLIPSLL